MEFIKAFFEELIKWVIMAIIAIIAVKAFDTWTYEEPSQMLIDIYKRDNTVHKI